MPSIEPHRRTFLQALNSRWIFGRLPLLPSIILLLEMAAVSILIQKFNTSYSQRPILTTMITNAILGGIADTTAQIITSMKQKAIHRKASSIADEEGFTSIEILDFDRKSRSPGEHPPPALRRQPAPFDFERLTRFMSYGFLMGPLQYKWFGFLHTTFPIVKGARTIPALKRVAFDQLLFAPVGLSMFFTFMTLAEGGGKKEVVRKFQDVYVGALKANYMLWPAVQIINFQVMPLQFQIPFCSMVGIAWTIFLSMANAADDS